MIIINLDDGSTKHYDIQRPQDLREFNLTGRDSKTLKRVSGLWLCMNGSSTTIPLPKTFKKFSFQAENIFQKKNGKEVFKGERLVLQIDDISATFTAYANSQQNMTRVDLQKTGKLMWYPTEVSA